VDWDNNISEKHAVSIFRVECFPEMLVSTYKTTWYHNPEEQHQHLHHENFKSYKMNFGVSRSFHSIDLRDTVIQFNYSQLLLKCAKTVTVQGLFNK
jgi:hypothetical protein